MITRWTRWLANFRRLLGRSQWTVRLLGLPSVTTNDLGLVLIQVDGLGESQLQAALKAGRMPTLQRLISDESYQLHTLYSGVPSSTPSVQGELFYGVRAIVPGFSFREPATGRIVSMLDSEEAERVETRLQTQAAGLLSGGSAYADVLSGGAAEPHYCSADFGWGGAYRLAKPWRVLTVATFYFPSFMRVMALLGVEAALATFDFVRGSLQGRGFSSELSCIPLRVAVTVLLRELTVFGASADVTRGVPIVHLNLLGYDEQAHRRGPDSAFAHWSLRGIDHAIQRVWSAAHRSTCRQYDVWIYSDHGQERCTPYLQHEGRSLEQAVLALLDDSPREPLRSEGKAAPRQVDWVGWGGNYKSRNQSSSHGTIYDRRDVQVAANGPLGFIYLNKPLAVEGRQRLAERLVDEAGCPFVLMRVDDNRVRYRVQQGWFDIDSKAVELLGADHPFLNEVAEDLASLARHPLAGELVVGGWSRRGESVSFAYQYGAHAGPGPRETAAFALLPHIVQVGIADRTYLRPSDLRNAARRLLQPIASKATDSPTIIPACTDSLRLVSYNVHGCVGMDGRLSVERVARVIARTGADIVALQELDVSRRRSGRQDQAQQIARLLEMDCHFHPAWAIQEEQYGDAVLSRLPMRLVRSGVLPSAGPLGVEPRGALWIEVYLGPICIHLINTHLGLGRREQARQIETLLSDDWLGAALKAGPTIMCGDCNFSPRSRQYQRVLSRIRDAYDDIDDIRPRPTFCSWAPLLRIDHVFVCSRLRAKSIGVVRNTLSRSASDHLPLRATLQLIGPAAGVNRDSDTAGNLRGAAIA